MKFSKIVLLLLLLLIPFFKAEASSPRIPVISDLNPGLKNFSEPFVSGFTDVGTNVLVYVNGKYVADAKTVHSNNINNFYFYLPSLPPEGLNTIFLIARDINGVLSAPSKEIEFLITRTLETPKIISIDKKDGFYLLAESANENYVDFYVDNKLYKTIFIERNSTNTFYFKPENLSYGNHTVYFVARDSVGRMSSKSNITSFEFVKPKVTVPSTKPNQTKQENKTTEEKSKTPSISNNGESEGVVVEGVDNINKEEDKIDLDEIIKQTDNGTSTGSLNEDGEKQSSLKWNLIIFILFLIAIVFWVVWVNKEYPEDESVEK